MWTLHLAVLEGFKKGRFSEVRFAHPKRYERDFHVFSFHVAEFCAGGTLFDDREVLDGWRDHSQYAFEGVVERGCTCGSLRGYPAQYGKRPDSLLITTSAVWMKKVLCKYFDG